MIKRLNAWLAFKVLKLNTMSIKIDNRICGGCSVSQIQALAVWGRAHYLSVTEAPHIIESYEWAGKKNLFLWNPRSSTFQAGSYNHCTRAPASNDEKYNIHNSAGQGLR